MRRFVTPAFVLAHVVALHAVVVWFRDPAHRAPAPSLPAIAPIAAPMAERPPEQLAAAPAPVEAAPVPRPGPLSLETMQVKDDRLTADLGNGWTAELALDPRLQKEARKALNRGRVPVGAVVVLDVATGDVLALADRVDLKHPAVPAFPAHAPPHVALRAFAPAASMFKLVTSAALLETGVSGRAQFAYTASVRKIGAEHLAVPARGALTSDLGDALAKSNNGFFARVANEKLDHPTLDAVVQRFGFNRVVEFDLLTDASTAHVPRNALERARMAAGFFHSKLTPLHAPAIAAAVARGGEMPRPRLVTRVTGPEGLVREAPVPAVLGRTMSPEVARELGRMMRGTVEDGTARRAFSQRPDSLAGVRIAGKTGSLRDPATDTDYTWFVGYAPADHPQIAFAVLVGNGELWYTRAADVARDVLAAYFDKVGEAPPAVATR